LSLARILRIQCVAQTVAEEVERQHRQRDGDSREQHQVWRRKDGLIATFDHGAPTRLRSEEHTSELQSLAYLVCRLLLEKKNACLQSYVGLSQILLGRECVVQ